MGTRYGLLTIVGRAPPPSSRCGGSYWLARCDCGRETRVRGSHFRNGHHSSCGCQTRIMLQLSKVKHGEVMDGIVSREYRIWRGMITRATNQNIPGHRWYADVTVCDRWRDFEAFIEDMGRCPSAMHSLDRYPDRDGNYEPGNCRWATRVQQNGNRRSTILLTHDGRTQSCEAWAREVGLRGEVVRARVRAQLPSRLVVSTAPLSLPQLLALAGDERCDHLAAIPGYRRQAPPRKFRRVIGAR